jgi:hypothetical protein
MHDSSVHFPIHAFNKVYSLVELENMNGLLGNILK